LRWHFARPKLCREGQYMSNRQGVTVFGEASDSKLTPISLELLGIGRTIADQMHQDLTALFVGDGISRSAEDALKYGANRVVTIDEPMYSQYMTDLYVAAVAKYDEHFRPEALLFGHTAIGRDLAPRLAFRLKTGLVLDCIDLTFDEATGLIHKVKPVYGGNAIATYVCERGRPQMAAIRPKAMLQADRNDAGTGELVRFAPDLSDSVIRGVFLSKVVEEASGIKLEDAATVVCGGRGLGGPEPFKHLQELANLLGGAVAASRPPCDSKWCPAQYQIGLTGKLVSPALYIGVALSGSSQHQAGMSGAKTIVAINKDEQANIFDIAHYGVVGEYQKVLPAFIQKCKELMSK
jgi:electron transfer flavoprotein alpha subunit